jgi:septal ring factor EnvC (AmiA/AmiB activator)
MVKGKCKNSTNRNQDDSPSSEHSTSTPPSPGHPNKPKKLDSDLKAYLMMMVEDIKKDFNNSVKEIQENTAKQVEDRKEETQKFLKELQENMPKQVMELNETIQDIKREVDTIKKTQSEPMLEIETEYLGEPSLIWDLSETSLCR